MRRSARIALGTAAAAVGAMALAVPAASAAETIANPGFESGLANWSCTSVSSAVTGHAHSGSMSLAGGANGSDNAQCTQNVSVTPNTRYTLSAFVNGNYVYIGATGTGTSDPSNWTPGTNGAYQQLSVTFTTGASTHSVTVFVHGWYAQGTYYADDFSMPGAGGGPSPSTAPPSTPNTSPSPKPTATSSPTPTPTGSPKPPPITTFRAPAYFMPLDNSPQNLGTAMDATGLKAFNLAFVLDSGGCTPAWNGDSGHKVSGDTTVLGMVNTVRSKGGDVSVSFGGYNGVELGATCGGSSGPANAYQPVVNRYALNRIDLDYEGDDLDANMAVRFGAIKILEQNNPNLKVSLTIPMTTVGLPDTGKDEIRQAQAAGARIDLVNIMAFDYGLTNAGDQVTSVKMVADAAEAQIKSLFGWDDATAYNHIGLQVMNGHTDQPSEMFTQSTFQSLLSYAQSKHFGWYSYWSLNRDRACDPSVPHNWADGTCSSVSQQPWEFSKIIAQYNG